MPQKLYIITKDKYSGHKRIIGFFRFQNNDLYYDFGSLKGSHNSYHKDGSQWRTSLATYEKPTKEGEHFPLSDFSGLFNLGTACISKNIIPKLSKVKAKHLNCTSIEIDLNAFPSENINIVAELIEPNYVIPLPEKEQCTPPDALTHTYKESKPWLNLTILGHEHNLLAIPNETSTVVNHYNERFTLNKEGHNYSSENYAGKVFDEHSKEI